MNFIEKTMNEASRNRFRTAVTIALGFFLGMRYNEYLSNLLAWYFPVADRGSMLVRGIVLIGITYAVVQVGIWLEKALDGR